jgi:hypothetical protein
VYEGGTRVSEEMCIPARGQGYHAAVALAEKMSGAEG